MDQPLEAPVLPPEEDCERFQIKEAILFGVKDPRLLAKCWWLPVISIFPPLSLPLMLGWKINIARRMAHGESHPLPEANQMGGFLASGVTIYCAMLLYYVPLGMILAFSGSSFAPDVMALLKNIYDYFFSHRPASEVLWTIFGIAMQIMADLVLPLAYSLGLWPFFQAAVVRYTLYRHKWAFLDPIGNMILLYKHAGAFLLAMLLTNVARVLLFVIISPLLTATFLGVFAVPLLVIPFYYGFTGHILGQLAVAVHKAAPAAALHPGTGTPISADQ